MLMTLEVLTENAKGTFVGKQESTLDFRLSIDADICVVHEHGNLFTLDEMALVDLANDPSNWRMAGLKYRRLLH